MATFKKIIQINAKSELEAITIATHLETMAKNLSLEALSILADKSRKPNIEVRLKSFKDMI